MSGQLFYNKNKKDFSRRSFLFKTLGAVGLFPLSSPFFQGCNKKEIPPIKGGIVGASSSIGHLLRDGMLKEPTEILESECVIVGGGVAGLSAGRHLKKNGKESFMILEMEAKVGGNSTFGQNQATAYPWGAHYLPIPNNENTDLLIFLSEAGAIREFDSDGLPIYNDYFLCFDPEERLHIHGHWQEGLVPHFGLPTNDLEEIKRFFELITFYKSAKGKDGKDAFTIPIVNSSRDEEFTRLDHITMKEYMHRNNFKSTYLLWYLDYCCRDDYGTNLENSSAWAGIHYFASRKGKAANADSSTVLTWPEGNGWLVTKLKEEIQDKICPDVLVYSVAIQNEKVFVDFYEVKTKKTKRVITDKCILASAQFVNKRILKEARGDNESIYENFSYAPWMVANITLENVPKGSGMPLSWDNVFFKSKSLGYVFANHQQLNSYSGDKVITFYHPLTDKDPVTSRIDAYKRSYEEWVEIILEDLSKAHRNIREEIKNIDVWLWGHGMIRPVPGFIWGKERLKASAPIKDKIFFANSDLSGVSIFEEAFYQGIRASNEALSKKESL